MENFEAVPQEKIETCLDCGFHGTAAGHLWSGCLTRPAMQAA